ncbi:hypothetical protein K2173_025681 [Erythroxylum novogranatense]|uniref:Protein kinase domain-containing protein n=1 Tax=Erythroxylum novogranatense TaxID=1862640 RepID=A0AAV8SB80_9ROSI|nr:hypothetical protein K2173_025681 [Erythroxylum novogranatense]
MKSEPHGSASQWIPQQQHGLAPVIPNSGKSACNVSVQTGEEFSTEFLQDRIATRGTPLIPMAAPNYEKRVMNMNDQNLLLAYEDLAHILGLKRMDSECPSDVSDIASARGSSKENENGANVEKFSRYDAENCENVHRIRRAFDELNCNLGEFLAQTASDTCISESPHANVLNGVNFVDRSHLGKMKFICSSGGKILPRPSDGKLRYVGGETRIISICKNFTWEELLKRTSSLCSQPHSIKYQLPGEDLDALISVASDEDLQNMIEEYHALEKLEGSQRLRLFLIPLVESEVSSSLEGATIQPSNPDCHYFFAVNSILDPSPRKNSGGLGLPSEANQSGIVLDHNPSFCEHASPPPPLEINGGVNAFYPSPVANNPHSVIRSAYLSPPISPLSLQCWDPKSAHMQIHGNSLGIESSNPFVTSQLPPKNCSGKTGIQKEALQGTAALTNHHHFIKQVDSGQAGQHHEMKLSNHNVNKKLDTDAVIGERKDNFDSLSSKKPMLKERAFHSDKPIMAPEDSMFLLSASIDSNDSCTMPHAFSDSKLQEHKGMPSYCSQEGISPSSPLNFAKAQSPALVLAASQEKAMQQHANISIVNHHIQGRLLEIQASGSQSGLALPNLPQFTGEKRVEPIQRDTTHTDERCQNQSSEGLESYQYSDPGEQHYEDKSAAANAKQKNKLIKVNVKHKVFDLNSFVGNMQVSGGTVPTSPAINSQPSPNSLSHNFLSYHLDGTSSNLIGVEQGITNLLFPISGKVNAGQVSNIPLIKSSQMKELLQNFREQPHDDNLLVDLISGHQTTAPSANLLEHDIHTSVLNVSQQNSTGKNVTFLGENCGCHSDQKAEKMSFTETTYGKSNVEEIILAKKISPMISGHKDQLEPLVNVQDVTDNVTHSAVPSCAVVPHVTDPASGVFILHTPPDSLDIIPRVCPYVVDLTSCNLLSPSATETVIPESELDIHPDDGGKDASKNDAALVEMEANFYGLQIIKNADLEELRQLGSGTYGTVYHGKWRGTDVAIKRIKKSCFSGRSSEQERLTEDFWREAHILSNLHHPNVVAFYGVVPDGAEGTMATVTEYMVNGSLRHALLRKDRSLDHRKKLVIAMDAAFGMEYLHSKNIVHFDLKCDNLLVNLRDPQRPICKVGDFGLSRIKRNTLVSGGVRGTLPWMAPELLNGSSSRVSEKVDVFSFGISLWEILTGEEPYADMHCGAIIGGIVKNTLRPPIPERCDPEWRKLMEQCWSPDPDSRPSFTEITDRLRSMSTTVQAKGHNIQARQTQ